MKDSVRCRLPAVNESSSIGPVPEPMNDTVRCRLPGLSRQAQGRLWIALQRRWALPKVQRESYQLPAHMTRSRIEQGWWALLTEFQDRPVMTVLGLLATLTYPILWLLMRFGPEGFAILHGMLGRR